MYALRKKADAEGFRDPDGKLAVADRELLGTAKSDNQGADDTVGEPPKKKRKKSHA